MEGVNYKTQKLGYWVYFSQISIVYTSVQYAYMVYQFPLIIYNESYLDTLACIHVCVM